MGNEVTPLAKQGKSKTVLLAGDPIQCDSMLYSWMFMRFNPSVHGQILLLKPLHTAGANGVYQVVHVTEVPQQPDGITHMVLDIPVPVKRGYIVGLGHPSGLHFIENWVYTSGHEKLSTWELTPGPVTVGTLFHEVDVFQVRIRVYALKGIFQRK